MLSICRVHSRTWKCQSCGATEGKTASEISPCLHLLKREGLKPSLFIADKPCLQHAFQKSCHTETLTFAKRKLHPELQSHLHMSVPEWATWTTARWVNMNTARFYIPSQSITNTCDFHKWITAVNHKGLSKTEGKKAAAHGITQVSNNQTAYHRASLCSISLRKPVWNLCKGSKLEKMTFFSVSGMQSSLFTALWNHYKEKRSKVIRGWNAARMIICCLYIPNPGRTLRSWH